MPQASIDFPQVLKHMTKLKAEFDEIVEELELLSKPGVRKQIGASLKAEKEGRTKTYTLTGFKKAIGL